MIVAAQSTYSFGKQQFEVIPFFPTSIVNEAYSIWRHFEFWVRINIEISSRKEQNET